jgi:hypothetical protein
MWCSNSHLVCINPTQWNQNDKEFAVLLFVTHYSQ